MTVKLSDSNLLIVLSANISTQTSLLFFSIYVLKSSAIAYQITDL